MVPNLGGGARLAHPGGRFALPRHVEGSVPKPLEVRMIRAHPRGRVATLEPSIFIPAFASPAVSFANSCARPASDTAARYRLTCSGDEGTSRPRP